MFWISTFTAEGSFGRAALRMFKHRQRRDPFLHVAVADAQ